MKNYQSLFRSYEEMDKIYQQLHAKGAVSLPYLVKVQNTRQKLIFFGCRHSNDIADPQNAEIEKEWHKFLKHDNPQKVAFCEGGVRPIESDKETGILKYSEPGLLTWLAHKSNIPIISPEPDETKEIQYLVSESFSVPQIMTYYFGRQMYQWLKRDYKNHADWKPYAERYIQSYAKLQPLSAEKLGLKKVLLMYQEVTGVPFNKNDEKLLYSLSDPTSNPVSAASGVFRDISLFAAIKADWVANKDVFALYGSGHAIVLEKAIKSL